MSAVMEDDAVRVFASNVTMSRGDHHADSVSWQDPKRYLWLSGLVVPTLPFIAWGAVGLTGLGVLWWLGLIVFVGLAAVDTLVGKDSTNPPDDVIKRLEADRYYRLCTYLFLPLQYISLAFACALWSSGGLSLIESLGLTVTVGFVGGIAINAAHELGHKRTSHEKWLSKLALAQTGYGHFQVEHNQGHHVRVATPEDPASSRLGESFWRFLPRSVLGTLCSAWRLEKARLDRVGARVLSPRNDVLNAWAMSVVLLVALLVLFGPGVLPWTIAQAVFGFCLLEAVNYLEHYGLLRQKREDGRYERCRPAHSWNSNNVASNIVLYHLQRHSDHHANPLRRYQALRHHDDAPELPAGYGAMIMLAWLTPLWRRVMDPRVIAHYGGDIARANIHPPARAALLARHR